MGKFPETTDHEILGNIPMVLRAVRTGIEAGKLQQPACSPDKDIMEMRLEVKPL